MSQIKILQLLSQSIEEEVPIIEIFEYFDYSNDTNIIDQKKDRLALQYVNKMIPNQTKIKIEPSLLNKFNLIHELIVVIHSKRWQIHNELKNFKERNEDLICFLAVSDRYNTLALINDLQSLENEVIQWETHKLQYVKLILIHLLKSSIVFPEIIFGINLDETHSSFEITLNKQMIQALKYKGLFKSGMKWTEMSDRKLIIGSLRLIIQEDVLRSKEMLEHVTALYEKNQISDVSEELKNFLDCQNKNLNSLEQIEYRDKIRELLTQFYLSYSLKVKIPIPEIITSIMISRRQSIRTNYADISISDNLLFLQSVNSNPELSEVNNFLKLQNFIKRSRITQEDFNDIKNKFSDYGVAKTTSQQQFLDMIQLVYNNKERLVSVLIKLSYEENYKNLINQYYNVNYLQVISSYYYKFLKYVWKIDQYLKSKDKDFIIDLNDQSDVIESNHNLNTQKSYFLGNNLQKLYKILVLLNRPHPEILKYIYIMKTKSGIGYIYFRRDPWFMPYLANAPDVLQTVKEIIEDVKGCQIDQSQVLQIFSEEQLPNKILGFNLGQIKTKEIVFILIILLKQNYHAFKNELKLILKPQFVNDLELIIKQNRQSNINVVATQALNSLQKMKLSLSQE